MAGTLTLSAATVRQGTPVAFTYTTGTPVAKNWIGVYPDPGRGPVDQKYVGAATLWQYTPAASGTGTVDTASLSPGRYLVFFLADDGYAWLAPPVAFAVTGAAPTSTLTLTSPAPHAGDQITFGYATSAPYRTNWVGIYPDPGGAPTGGHSNGGAMAWRYTPDAAGTVTFDGSAFYPGTFVALLLARDGYTALAGPVGFTVGEPVRPPTPRFVTGTVTSRNVAAGAPVGVSVAGLWTGGPAPTFAKVGGDGWLTVAADGTIGGTAPLLAPQWPGTVVVAAGDARLTVRVPVAPLGERLADQLRVMTWDLGDGGHPVSGAHAKRLRILLDHNVDAVALQNAGENTRELALALGWEYVTVGGLGVLSRYPLVGTSTPDGLAGTSARIRLGARDVVLWTVDLAGAGDPLTRIRAVLAALAPDVAAGTAVVVGGALRTRSHLDSAGPQPVTLAVEAAGLRDSYRVGRTTEPGATLDTGRVDYLHYAGDPRVTETHVLRVGWPRAAPEHAGNAWPSEHAAVVTTFRLP